MPGKIRQYFKDKKGDARDSSGGGMVGKLLLIIVVVYLLIAMIVGMYWSSEPDSFSVREHTRATANAMQREPVTGFATTATMIRIAETLLDKPGGYITNDIFPPGVWLDNMPNWEFGVLVQVRDLARAMRQDISRAQSQSSEDADLIIAEPQLHFDSDSWAIPSTESEYRRGITALKRYLDRLSSPDQADAQFYTRADSLNSWLADLETRLGSLSRTLGESVGKASISETVADSEGQDPLDERTDGADVKTDWTKIDDVFYEARGSSWALLHIFRAIEVDFRKVLQDKNATASVKQIIIELEGAQGDMWSPVILNGSGFGIMANHSLTMAAYLSRANAAISDMRALLSRG
ncbi:MULTISPECIES: DUF2333 family protein [unclassified Marinobacter]|uniref:DUF2333 family protein n=1 Tax=unclassified Marinobacter TaxID=83889 RepID=UPI00200E380F|nr:MULTISPECIES: DUF2333 family protein [unclassified Marinobacter]UQG55605.1 DUF2333 family protein [Marinobacter sp. M4C]UQG64409.1 DUF2333 family protein [Marinobacter sp. M2C]UQG68688.1 DUF2333 family protein [Marinobacter sp. M1C]